MLLLIGLALFLHPGCFLFSISLPFWKYKHMLLLAKYCMGINLYLPSTQYCKLNFKNLILKKFKPEIFFNFHYRVIHQYRLYIWKFMQIIRRGSQVMTTINLQCNSPSQIHSSVLLQTNNGMTGRAYTGELLIQNLAEIHEEMSELLDKQMNV